MITFSIVCFSFVSVTIVTSLLPTADHYKCFENYMQQIILINIDYENSLLACYDEDNINRRPPHQLDPQAELEKCQETLKQICLNQKACNLKTDLLEFFNCHSKIAEENAHKIFAMQLNASSVALELNNQNDQEKKEILRCQLAAKRKHFTESSILYNKHLNCLHTFEHKRVERMLLS